MGRWPAVDPIAQEPAEHVAGSGWLLAGFLAASGLLELGRRGR